MQRLWKFEKVPHTLGARITAESSTSVVIKEQKKSRGDIAVSEEHIKGYFGMDLTKLRKY
jgi:hypothetical protein